MNVSDLLVPEQFQQGGLRPDLWASKESMSRKTGERFATTAC